MACGRAARARRFGHRPDGSHIVFFLHITTGSDNTNNVLALAFGMLIVTLIVAGSLWIMANLNANMMPPADLIDLHIQH
jgi:cytochrome o ubiquinol oxidase operon protein cyoD